MTIGNERKNDTAINNSLQRSSLLIEAILATGFFGSRSAPEIVGRRIAAASEGLGKRTALTIRLPLRQILRK